MSLNELVGQFLVAPVGLILLFMAPLVGVGFLLNSRRKQYKAHATNPFTEMPLRPPGESSREKIEQLTEEFDVALISCLIASLGGACLVIGKPIDQKLSTALACGLLVLITYIVSGRSMYRVQKALWNYRLGFTGERMVGEHLNQLLASGYQVFHDVPFEKHGKKFNIDHVLVGPSGVFAVETKARRKPADVKGLPKATVHSDGEILRFPKYEDMEAIPQARRNAKELAAWLSKATGERIETNAILTLPGWRIERTKSGDVNVLRPDEIKRSFPTRPRQPLDAGQIQRISYQLGERCRLSHAG